MFAQLAQLQGDVVNAFLDSVEHDPNWTRAFIHAEFADDGETGPRSLSEAFIVRPRAQAPDFILLDDAVAAALEALHAGYARAGQGFSLLDMTIAAPEGRYRCEFSSTPSLRLTGQPDPDADDRLLRRYALMLAEN